MAIMEMAVVKVTVVKTVRPHHPAVEAAHHRAVEATHHAAMEAAHAAMEAAHAAMEAAHAAMEATAHHAALRHGRRDSQQRKSRRSENNPRD
jgi:hypothetical protein